MQACSPEPFFQGSMPHPSLRGSGRYVIWASACGIGEGALGRSWEPRAYHLISCVGDCSPLFPTMPLSTCCMPFIAGREKGIMGDHQAKEMTWEMTLIKGREVGGIQRDEGAGGSPRRGLGSN